MREWTTLGLGFEKAENIRLKSKEKKIIALKFVKFEEDDGENFEGQGFVIEDW